MDRGDRRPLVAQVKAESFPPARTARARTRSGALLTPVQTPANLMVIAPGGYRFGDYWKLGLPILILWFAVALIVIPIVLPLTP